MGCLVGPDGHGGRLILGENLKQLLKPILQQKGIKV
jgi:hypothetical protein